MAKTEFSVLSRSFLFKCRRKKSGYCFRKYIQLSTEFASPHYAYDGYIHGVSTGIFSNGLVVIALFFSYSFYVFSEVQEGGR